MSIELIRHPPNAGTHEPHVTGLPLDCECSLVTHEVTDKFLHLPSGPFQVLITRRSQDELINGGQWATLYEMINRLRGRSDQAGRTTRDNAYPERTSYELTDVGRELVSSGWLKCYPAASERDALIAGVGFSLPHATMLETEDLHAAPAIAIRSSIAQSHYPGYATMRIGDSEGEYMAPMSRVTRGSVRNPDRVAGALAAGFVVLLLATELVLSLPDETHSAAIVASFYATHRTLIIILQLLGFLAAVLLAAYAWRLRSVDQVVAATGLAMAVCGLVPGFITLVITVVADPHNPARAARWNMLEPRGDDILFLGIVVFAGAVAVRLGRHLPALGLLALFVAISCLMRLGLEIVGKSRGPLDTVGPLSFLVLIAVMAVLSFRGLLGAD